MIKLQALLLLIISFGQLQAQEIFNLYTGAIPNSKVVLDEGQGFKGNPGLMRKIVRPTLEAFLPDSAKKTGTAVIICPGGAYGVLVYSGEGVSTAKEFAKNGIAAFVLKYRLPDDSIEINKTIAPLQDAQQAMKIVRENAAKWGIDPQKIGIVGFSAGGHLASTLATHYSESLIENNSNTSLRPDFQVLVYPVISMQDKLTHLDSRRNLLGSSPSSEIIDFYSNEMQVDENTPQAYITHAGDDNLVDVDNSIGYFEQLRHNKVPVELLVYPKGGHGFIFKQKDWMEPLIKWMEASGLLIHKK